MYENLNRAFTLRVRLRTDEPMIIIHAYDGPHVHPAGRSRLDLEVRQGGRTIFARGDLWITIPGFWATDGAKAKEAALSCVAMRPGDTDPDYFAHYSDEQLDWARANGEALSCEGENRYGDV